MFLWINKLLFCKDSRSKKQIRCEIIDSVISHIFNIWGGVGIPSKFLIMEATDIDKSYWLCALGLSVMREVATTLAIKYPKMFEDVGGISESPLGYGLGGKLGNKYLDKHLVERVIMKID